MSVVRIHNHRADSQKLSHWAMMVFIYNKDCFQLHAVSRTQQDSQSEPNVKAHRTPKLEALMLRFASTAVSSSDDRTHYQSRLQSHASATAPRRASYIYNMEMLSI